MGYYFGRMLHKELGVPVGLVNTSYGGATAQAYTPIEALEGDSRLKANFVDPYKAIPDMNVLVRPAELYNSMVHPLLPLSARGVVWYQGEGNWGDYPIYPLLMKTLINGWRRNFAHSEMPFYYVQLAPWGFVQDTSSKEWFYTQGEAIGYAYMREAQALTREQVSHSGMAVTMDVGDPDDIHPTNKRPVGERLALLAHRDLRPQRGGVPRAALQQSESRKRRGEAPLRQCRRAENQRRAGSEAFLRGLDGRFGA